MTDETYFCPICGDVTDCPHYDPTRKPRKPKAKGRYDGTHCPYCNSSNIISLEQVQMDGSFGTQTIECLDCKKRWYDILKLVGWEETK